MRNFNGGLNFNKSKRMQIKAALCLAAILLLFVIAGGLFIKGCNFTGEEKKSAPVVVEMHNTYITEVTDTGISVFDGENRRFLWQEGGVRADAYAVGQIADVVVTDGEVTSLVIKNTEKINGKVISVSQGAGVEVEEKGFLPFSEEVRFFMLYGQLRTGSERDIRIGYNFADFVVEDGKICAVLLTRDETMEYIRVLIKNSDFAGSYHDTVTISCDTDYILQYSTESGMAEEAYPAGETLTVTQDSVYFAHGGERLFIVPSALTGKISLPGVNRSQGTPAYRGIMEIGKTEKGLTVINEVLLEEYLYAVVPSEMPSGYPIEALKAQAVCARTYAYSHMLSPGLPGLGAHVDDSTGYQVYNNIIEQNSTTTAVKETAGQLLFVEGSLVSTYYYSTSCGFGSDEHVWKSENAAELPYLTSSSISIDGMEGKESIYTAENMCEEAMFAQFLSYPPETDFEKEEAWYRWTYEVNTLDGQRILNMLQSRYETNSRQVLTLKDGEYVSEPVEKLGKIKNISILSRNAGGVADELLIEGEEAVIKVLTELNIRYVLCDGVTQVVRNDGSKVDMKSLLPSGFFTIAPIQSGENMVGYKLSGGGFGHGAGMSQNGAKNMAEAGYTAEQILGFFYKGSNIANAAQN